MKKVLLSLLSFCIAISVCIPCYASSGNIYEKNITVSKDDCETFTPDNEIKVNGKKFILKTSRIIKEETPTFTITEEGLLTKNANPDKCALNPENQSQHGELQSIEYKENVKQNRKTDVRKKVEYKAVLTDFSAPKSYSFEYTDKETSAKMNIDLKLFDVSVSNPYWIHGQSINGTVTGYDALSYELENSNISIPNNSGKPIYKGYETGILKSLGLNPDNYKITNSSWDGNTYKSNNQLCRNLNYTVDIKVCDVTAFYSDEITLPDLTTYQAIATYADVDNTVYTFQLTYEKAKISAAAVITTATVGIIVLSALIASVIFILSKKRKEELDGIVTKRIQNIRDEGC